MTGSSVVASVNAATLGQLLTISGQYKPGTSSGSSARVVSFTVTDSAGLTSAVYTLQFTAIAVNTAPKVWFVADANAGVGSYQENYPATAVTAQLTNGIASGSAGWYVTDPDSGNGALTATITMVPISGAKMSIAVPNVLGVTTVLSVGTQYQLTAPLSVLSGYLSAVTFSATADGVANVTVVVSDNGFSGACSVTDSQPCSLYAYGSTVITINSAGSITGAAVGGAAGAAALGAAAAAAIAWKKLRSPPTDSYNPWEMDDSNEGTVLNPLFEDTGKSGDNPMFEGSK